MGNNQTIEVVSMNFYHYAEIINLQTICIGVKKIDNAELRQVTLIKLHKQTRYNAQKSTSQCRKNK